LGPVKRPSAVSRIEPVHQHSWTGRTGIIMTDVRIALAAAVMAGAAAMVSACTYRWHRPSAALRSTERVAVAEDTQLVAVVESVNERTREIALRGQHGERVVVTAGPEVRNLAQLRRGDRVVVTYGETLAVEIAPPGSGWPPLEVAEGAVRAPPGQRPGAAAGRQVRARVRIEAVDGGTGRVAFIGPGGVRRVVTPREPEMVDFARRLRPGDEVDVTYTEAAAVRVEPANR
jgi:hypothetical protein